jgi:hypothetical protein
MNTPPTPQRCKPKRAAVHSQAISGRRGGMRRGGVWNAVEGRRGRQKIWRNNTLGFGGLQHVEIPQNRQSFVWKSLEQNTLDLEKLGETQGGPPLFRHLRSELIEPRKEHADGEPRLRNWRGALPFYNILARNLYTPDLLMSASSSARVTGTRYSATHSSRSRAR